MSDKQLSHIFDADLPTYEDLASNYTTQFCLACLPVEYSLLWDWYTEANCPNGWEFEGGAYCLTSQVMRLDDNNDWAVSPYFGPYQEDWIDIDSYFWAAADVSQRVIFQIWYNDGDGWIHATSLDYLTNYFTTGQEFTVPTRTIAAPESRIFRFRVGCSFNEHVGFRYVGSEITEGEEP